MNPLEQLLSSMDRLPRLDGAKCVGLHRLMDPQHPGEPDTAAAARHHRAMGVCQTCPALPGCRSWLLSLPPRKRPLGVVAGQLITEPVKRNKAS